MKVALGLFMLRLVTSAGWAGCGRGGKPWRWPGPEADALGRPRIRSGLRELVAGMAVSHGGDPGRGPKR